MIDRALEQNPADFDALLKLLSEMGCEVSRRGKAIRLKAPGWKNVARMDDKLGAGYSEAEIRAVLAGEKQHTPRKKNRRAAGAAEGQSTGGHSGKIAGRKGCWLCSMGQSFQSEANGADHELPVRA